jgi:molybdenum cofactor biosynthesis protein MoaC
MVDVSSKVPTVRTAVARSEVELPPAGVFHEIPSSQSPRFVTHCHVACLCAVARELLGAEWMVGLASGGMERPQLNPHSKKGPIITTAIIAGVQGVKRTSELIPFCHPLPLHHCGVDVSIGVCTGAEEGTALVTIDCTATTEGKTGVEMEALTGASVAALTVYDMTKALSHDIVIRNTRLLTKTGGKSDYGTTR